jgi:GGDEF domain-containing protein
VPLDHDGASPGTASKSSPSWSARWLVDDQVCRFAAVPSRSTFASVLEDRGTEPGTLLVIFLATFRPIGSQLGIPAVIRASAELARRVKQLAPPGSLVGSLSAWTTGVFVPGRDPAVITNFVAALVHINEHHDLEIEAGGWVEIRAAVGAVPITGTDNDARALLTEAARRATADLGRFPDDWQYPIVID